MLERVCRHARSFDVIAVEIARRSEIPLKIAAKIDRADQEYFDARITGLIDGSLVDFIGEITEVEKTCFLGDAIALGLTGFIVDDLNAAVTCVARARSLNRRRCREVFEQRFQVARMSQGYCEVYELARQRTCPVMS
jgi:hypothetical protein